MSQGAPVSRPGGVTLVVVLMWIAGILEMIGGLVYLWLSFNPSQVPSVLTGQQGLALVDASANSGNSLTSILLILGIFGIVLGLITVLLASALKNGSNGVRIFMTIIIVFQILADAYDMVTLHGNAIWMNLLGILVWLIALGLLWSSRASAFFHQR